MKKSTLVLFYSACFLSSASFIGAQTVTFSQPAGSPLTNGTYPRGISTADLNNDGKMDLVVGNAYGPTLNVFLGNGNGTFSGSTAFATGNGPICTAIGDFNGDHKADLATVNYSDGTVAIMLGNGAGSFSMATGSPIPVGTKPYGVDTADFNHDGHLDLVVVNQATSDVFVLLGAGNGTFAIAPGSPFPAGNSPYSVTTGDFNGDHIPDMAFPNGNDNTLSVMLGVGDGSFNQAANSPFPVGTNPRTIAIKDLNGDQKLDIVVANQASNNVSILLGDGTGSFSNATGSPVTVGSGATQAVIVDVDINGKWDLVVTNAGSNSITILLGAGDGTFSNPTGSPHNLGAGTDPQSIASADFNGDGKPDLAIGEYAQSSTTILLDTSPMGVFDYGSTANQVLLFPNPASTKLSIQVKTLEEHMTFALYNALGQQISSFKMESNTTTLDRNNLPAGIYLYMVRSEGRICTSGHVVFEN